MDKDDSMATKADEIQDEYFRLYEEMFAKLGQALNDVKHEWNKPGDKFTRFSLYSKDGPPAVLTSYTFPLK